ncbi:hypothetical protein Q9233_006913 [Columba guinea]|nr:hypothetical protein Q9233_006913 [Columba guinea]
MEAVDQLASAGTFRVVKEPLAFLRVLEWFSLTFIHTLTAATGVYAINIGLKKTLMEFRAEGRNMEVGSVVPYLYFPHGTSYFLWHSYRVTDVCDGDSEPWKASKEGGFAADAQVLHELTLKTSPVILVYIGVV